MKESCVMKAHAFALFIPKLCLFPESLTKGQIDLQDIARDQTLNGYLLGNRQIRNESNASAGWIRLKYLEWNGDDDCRSRVINTRRGAGNVRRLTYHG